MEEMLVNLIHIVLPVFIVVSSVFAVYLKDLIAAAIESFTYYKLLMLQ